MYTRIMAMMSFTVSDMYRINMKTKPSLPKATLLPILGKFVESQNRKNAN